MPRRNLYWLAVVAIVSSLCYARAETERRASYAEFLGPLERALGYIEDDYVQPVERGEMFDGAVRGMFSKLDEHSSYLGPETFARFQQSIDGQFGGVGMQLMVDEESKSLVVMSPLVGTPAYAAGIHAGDKIVAIDKQATDGWSLTQAVEKLRGRAGEAVELSVVPGGEDQPRDFKLVRQVIKVESVLGDVHDEHDQWRFTLEEDPEIAYIRINSFDRGTVKDLSNVLLQLDAQPIKPKAIILDLRDNGGGLLESAVAMCDLFLDGGVIVSIKGRGGKVVEEHVAHPGGRTDTPMCVLINGNSASASEIVSACLQDHNRATIVGERSWGKGSVQNVIDLRPGRDAIKLTIATYWRPSNRNIHRKKDAKPDDEWGVQPNPSEYIKLTPEQLDELAEFRRHRDVVGARRSAADGSAPEGLKPTEADPALRRAVEVLRAKIGPAVKAA